MKTSPHSGAKTLLAALGAIPAALAAGAVLGWCWPGAGLYSVFPLWVGLTCSLSLAPDGTRAWAIALGACSALLLMLLR
jgi:hypothetical protein